MSGNAGNDQLVMAMVNTNPLTIVKANGQHEAFDVEKLRFSLMRSGASEDASLEVIKHLMSELKDGMTTHDIYQYAFSLLNNTNKKVARSYSLRRAVMDLGPSGFPFEDFVAEILRAKGFRCLTRQTVLGGCVPHEVDVVAYNDKKLVMVEAKFHNELGTKSDLKVVLYIKARFDDLKDNVFNYGRENRKVTDGWLITNTKFSSTAIHYAICKDMTLIGWNYPEKGSLQDMIEEESLHPITALTTLKESEKKALLANGVVLCSNIKNNPEVLQKFLGQDFDSSLVINEIIEL
ncbi:MAG: ATPase [Candidatus Zambryskibacteria bacterium]|nr:ATPase [Candidatus Zambryskibacteria bacterium]